MDRFNDPLLSAQSRRRVFLDWEPESDPQPFSSLKGRMWNIDRNYAIGCYL